MPSDANRPLARSSYHHSSFIIHHSRRAFSLIELITVLTIFSLLIAISVGTYYAWNQTAALRGATDLTLSGLTRARQYAITQRVPTYFYFTNANPRRAYFAARTNSITDARERIDIEPPRYLPLNITLQIFPSEYSASPHDDAYFYFKPNGRPYNEHDDTPFDDDLSIILTRGATNLTQTIRIDPLTGHARAVPRQEQPH